MERVPKEDWVMPTTSTGNAANPNSQGSTAILAARLADLHIGTPVSFQALTLIPVYASVPAQPIAYETFATALAGKRAVVTEVGGGSVPELGVKQSGTLPVLLLDGDQLIGGRQNRVLNTTLLVPVGVDFVVPVSCVEQGRWHQTRVDFGTGEIVPPSLRYSKQSTVSDSYRRGMKARANQSEVWRSVSETLDRTAAYSPTSDLYEAYQSMDSRIEETRMRLGTVPTGAVGVVAVIDGQARAADLFDKPETLAEFWPRLVRSYALEAVNAGPTDDTFATAAAQALLEAGVLASRAATAFPAHGLGEDVRVTAPDVQGAALVHAGVAIHAILFGTGRTTARLPQGRIATQLPSGPPTEAQSTATTPATDGTGGEPTGGASLEGTSSLFQAVFGARSDGGAPTTPVASQATSTTPPSAPVVPVQPSTQANAQVVFESNVGAVRLQVVQGNLLETECGAIVLGTNKRLSGSSGLPGAIERAAGRAFVGERDRRILSAASGGFYRGSAIVTGSGNLRDGQARRALIHAIVTKFEHGSRVPTTPDIVYAAYREALQLAETYGIGSVATHPVATRATPPGTTPLATAPAEVMVRAVWDAIVDHARVARRTVRVQVYERDASRLASVVRGLQDALADA
jgi:O-acetyl-ADP-ribose deacetylase (regulator of RNase III)